MSISSTGSFSGEQKCSIYEIKWFKIRFISVAVSSSHNGFHCSVRVSLLVVFQVFPTLYLWPFKGAGGVVVRVLAFNL